MKIPRYPSQLQPDVAETPSVHDRIPFRQRTRSSLDVSAGKDPQMCKESPSLKQLLFVQDAIITSRIREKDHNTSHFWQVSHRTPTGRDFQRIYGWITVHAVLAWSWSSCEGMKFSRETELEWRSISNYTRGQLLLDLYRRASVSTRVEVLNSKPSVLAEKQVDINISSCSVLLTICTPYRRAAI